METLDFAGIRIYVEKNIAHPIYEALVSGSGKCADDYPFSTMKDLFLISACFGAKHNIYLELQSKRDIFSGEIFNSQTDVPVLASLAFKRTKNLDVISNPKEVIEIAQCWANGGIQKLRDELLKNPGLSPLLNFIDLIRDNN